MQSPKQPTSPKKPIILNERFQLIKFLGKGQYSEVFHAIDLENKEEVAVKYQQKSPFHSNKTVLHQESVILEQLRNISGVPEKKLFLENKEHDLLILPIYKETLKSLFDKFGKFTLPTVIVLALELIDILEQIHSKNIVHLDLKPENIMIGPKDNKNKELCIIDYGLSVSFFDEQTQKHVDLSKNNVFAGTFSYASLNSHLGLQQSRRDDLESLGYILVYFVKGCLPWQFYTCESPEQRRKKSHKLKKEISIDVLCEDMPAKFKDYFKYVRGLKFEEKPDYNYLRGLFQALKKEIGMKEIDKVSFTQWIENENYQKENLVKEDDEWHGNCKKVSEKYFSDNLKFNNSRHRRINSFSQKNEGFHQRNEKDSNERIRMSQSPRKKF